MIKRKIIAAFAISFILVISCMYVAGILPDFSRLAIPDIQSLKLNVYVKFTGGTPVSGASVKFTWTSPTSRTVTKTTDSNGYCYDIHAGDPLTTNTFTVKLRITYSASSYDSTKGPYSWPISGYGLFEKTKTFSDVPAPAPAKSSTSLTASWSAPTMQYDCVALGDPLTATGKLTSGGSGLGGKTIRMQESSLGTVATTSTASDGSYKVSWIVPSSAGSISVRTYFPGDSSYYSSSSGYHTIYVEERVPTLTLTIPLTVGMGESFDWSGYLTDPKVTSAALSNRPIYLQLWDTSKYMDVSGPVWTDANGYYSGSAVAPKTSGTYSYRTRFPGDSPATVSDKTVITVKEMTAYDHFEESIRGLSLPMWEIISVAAFIAIMLLGKHFRMLLLGEFIIGFCWGVYWEFSATPLFLYKGFTIYLGAVPVAILILWGDAVATFIFLSNIAQKLLNIESLVGRLLSDFIITGSLGTLMEYLGSHQLQMWQYPPGTVLHPLLDVPIGWIQGWWITVGLFITTFARTYDKIFESPLKIE